MKELISDIGRVYCQKESGVILLMSYLLRHLKFKPLDSTALDILDKCL